MILKWYAALVAFAFKHYNNYSNITAQQDAFIPKLFLFDDYKKCLFNNDSDVSIYCRVSIELFPKDFEKSSLSWNIIKEVSFDKWNYNHTILRHGICASKVCESSEDVSNCLNVYYKDKYKDQGLVGQVITKDCETKISDYNSTNLDFFLISILGFYLLFVFLVNIWLEIKKFVSNKNKYQKTDDCIDTSRNFLSAFSISENLGYLFNFGSKPAQNYMPYIQGIRFVISVIVITVHSQILLSIPIKNPSLIEEAMHKIYPAFFSRLLTLVQGFFVISGWLITINFYSTLKKRDELGFGFVVRSIIRRYIRLVPGLVVLLILHSTYLVRLFRGPLWQFLLDEEHKVCRQSLWLHLFCITNFFPDSLRCMPHIWYLSVDFQLSVLSFMMLWLSQKRPKIFFMLVSAVVSYQVISMFFYLEANNFEFGLSPTPEIFYNITAISMEEFRATWTSTNSNLSGMVIGLFFGYLYVTCNKKASLLARKYKTLWYILTFSLIFGIVFYSTYYMSTPYYSNSRLFAATFGTLIKPLFVFGIGLFIFGISQGLGGCLKKYLELPLMHTLGQLSFGAYLIHLTIAKVLLGLHMELIEVSTIIFVYYAIQTLVLAYLGSIVYTSLILLPVDRLSKKFLK